MHRQRAADAALILQTRRSVPLFTLSGSAPKGRDQNARTRDADAGLGWRQFTARDRPQRPASSGTRPHAGATRSELGQNRTRSDHEPSIHNG